jgi:hypothetical protein
MKKRLQKCLILLENIYPLFPTFPHARTKFTEMDVKVKYKNHRKSGVFVWVEKGLIMLRFRGGEESPLCGIRKEVESLLGYEGGARLSDSRAWQEGQ